TGIHALTTEQGLALFDTATTLTTPALVPIKLDLKTLRSSTDELPDLFRSLIRTTTRRTASTKADPGAIRKKLVGLEPAQQEKVLLTLVVEHAATVLGHGTPDAVDPDKDFLEAGFDSLSAMELRSTLNSVTGLGLPPMVIFDNKTPAGLARCLRDAYTVSAGDQQTAQQLEQDRSTDERDTVSGLFRSTVLAGQTTKAFNLLRAVADLRPTFDSYAEIAGALTPVKLADGPARPRLICLSTPMATGGVHQHARLAAHFRDVRYVATLPTPGFEPGESLPASVDALTSVLAKSVLAAAGGEPFVLLGYSSGGVLAHGTAARLEQQLGTPAAGLVLVDTYRVTEEAGGGMQAHVFEQMSGALVDRDSEYSLFNSTGLSAMRAYFDLLPQFELGSISTPALFVGAGQSFLSAPEDDSWQARPWDATHTYRTVPATHFSIVEEEAGDTARVVEEWVSGLA
ncbi:thioesterase domain-containing protein, partial [Nocardia sp. NPDC058633]|uniref:thioesterase domain-containing protein n=1 Tax=Nocardia sp. NPDC058633 TaxID=3346568 RepID=UPI0036668BC5